MGEAGRERACVEPACIVRVGCARASGWSGGVPRRRGPQERAPTPGEVVRLAS